MARLWPKRIKKWTQLTWWAELSNGTTIFRDENNVGGHRYWSDEIGGGVIVWDTSLVNPETLKACLRLEGVATEKMAGYIAGQWGAFNRVLNLINTIDEKMVDKAKLHSMVMDLRPEDLRARTNNILVIEEEATDGE